MRRLGAALGMDPIVVPYRFFGTKDDLLEVTAISFLGDVAPDEGLHPVANIEQGFREFRRVLIEVPNLLALVDPRLLTTSAALRPAAWVVQQLTGPG